MESERANQMTICLVFEWHLILNTQGSSFYTIAQKLDPSRRYLNVLTIQILDTTFFSKKINSVLVCLVFRSPLYFSIFSLKYLM